MKKNQIKRMELMIANDRLTVRDELLKILKKDLRRVLGDYFDINGEIDVVMNKNGAHIETEIRFISNSVKSFSSIPCATENI